MKYGMNKGYTGSTDDIATYAGTPDTAAPD
jgi:hypothetical protein